MEVEKRLAAGHHRLIVLDVGRAGVAVSDELVLAHADEIGEVLVDPHEDGVPVLDHPVDAVLPVQHVSDAHGRNGRQDHRIGCLAHQALPLAAYSAVSAPTRASRSARSWASAAIVIVGFQDPPVGQRHPPVT